MELFYDEIILMTKRLVFGPFDLKDVYFFINIVQNSREFFRFKFDKFYIFSWGVDVAQYQSTLLRN